MLLKLLKLAVSAAVFGSALSLSINAYYAAPIILWTSLLFAVIIGVMMQRLSASSNTKTTIANFDILVIFIFIYLMTMIIQSVAIYSILT